MKQIILYTRRSVGLYALSLLVAGGCDVKVITDDENVKWLADTLGCELVEFDTMGGFDLFLCVHGNKILPKEILQEGKMVNIHPCLFKYRGQNPVKRYIKNKDTKASVESHWMVEEVDAGEVICQEFFDTMMCHTYADFYNQAVDKYYRVIAATVKKVLG